MVLVHHPKIAGPRCDVRWLRSLIPAVHLLFDPSCKAALRTQRRHDRSRMQPSCRVGLALLIIKVWWIKMMFTFHNDVFSTIKLIKPIGAFNKCLVVLFSNICHWCFVLHFFLQKTNGGENHQKHPSLSQAPLWWARTGRPGFSLRPTHRLPHYPRTIPQWQNITFFDLFGEKSQEKTGTCWNYKFILVMSWITMNKQFLTWFCGCNFKCHCATTVNQLKPLATNNYDVALGSCPELSNASENCAPQATRTKVVPTCSCLSWSDSSSLELRKHLYSTQKDCNQKKT